jgi:hypothetical protein
VRREIVPQTLAYTGKEATLTETDDQFRVVLPARRAANIRPWSPSAVAPAALDGGA